VHPFPPVPRTRSHRRDLRVRRETRWPRRLFLVAACTLALVAVPIAVSPTFVVAPAPNTGAEQAPRTDDTADRSAVRSAAPITPKSPTPTATPTPEPPTIVDEIVTRTNAERAAAGLPALEVSPCATDQAAARSATLVAEDRFEHDPLEPVLAACAAQTVGENLALGYPTALAAVAGWMGSDGHRANILGDAYTAIGVGCATGPHGLLCAQVFLG
jgi:uncharacterized protein YkwD